MVIEPSTDLLLFEKSPVKPINIFKNSIPQLIEKNERQIASWDIRNAFRNYSTLVFSQIISALFSFASVWLATHFLSPERYGTVVAIIAASQIAQVFVNWSCVALARFGVEEFVESGEISKSFWARTLIFLLNAFIFLALSFFWLPLLANWLKLAPATTWYVVVHFIVLAGWLHIQHALQGAKLPRLQGGLIAFEKVLVFLLLLYFVRNNSLTDLQVIAAYIASPLLMIVIGLFQIRNLVSWRIEVDLGSLKKILKFSIPLIPFSLIGIFSTGYLDAIFIVQYLSKTELGLYSIAYQINGILMQFPLLAGSLLMPLFVTLQNETQEAVIKKYISDVLPLLTFSWGLICVFVAVCGMFFIPLIFGDTVAESSNILWILVISSALSFPSLGGYIPYINMISATYVGTPMAIGAAVTNLAANYFLIPKYGLMGCAWATVLSFLASLLIIFAFVHFRHSHVHRWTWQALLPTIIICVYYSWSKSLLLSFFMGAITVVFLAAIYQKYWRNGIRLMIAYRKYAVS